MPSLLYLLMISWFSFRIVTVFLQLHRSDPVRALLMLKLFPGIRELRFDYDFGGDQQGPGFDDFIEIK